MDIKCMSCKTYAKELTDESAVCQWWMDNVVCGDKDIEDCTDYEEVDVDA